MPATLGGKSLDELAPITLEPIGGRFSLTAARAETSWLDAQVQACEVRYYEGVAMNLLLRIERATIWLSQHERTHANFQLVTRRLDTLTSSLASCRTHMATDARLCWLACIDLHLCLQRHRDPQSWLASHPADLNLFPPTPAPANRITSIDPEPRASLPATRTSPSPLVIWAVLMGDRPVPGSWPLEKPAAELLTLRRVEAWHLEWLKVRLAEWSRTGVADTRTQGQDSDTWRSTPPRPQQLELLVSTN